MRTLNDERKAFAELPFSSRLRIIERLLMDGLSHDEIIRMLGESLAHHEELFLKNFAPKTRTR